MRNCFAAVMLCAIALGSAMPGAMPNCGRRITKSGPACCLNEATCPMHHKQPSIALGTCHGGRTDSPIVVVHHNAVLVTTAAVQQTPVERRIGVTSASLVLSEPRIPATPPPRSG